MVLNPNHIVSHSPESVRRVEDTLDNQAAQVKRAKRQRLVWMPGKLNNDGSVENVIQGRMERRGPKQGRWSKRPKQTSRAKNYKRFWIEGQHNYMRQRNPKHPDEPIIGSRVQNVNAKMILLKNPAGNYESYLEDGAVILSFGMLKPAYVTTQDDIFLEAVSETKRVLDFKNAPPEQQGVNCGGSKSGGSGPMEGLTK